MENLKKITGSGILLWGKINKRLGCFVVSNSCSKSGKYYTDPGGYISKKLTIF